MPGTIEEDKVEIPVIDLNSPNAPEELLDAAARYGFIFVKHDKVGLEPAQVDSMFQLSRDFFTSPTEVKAKCTINSSQSGKNKGWLSMHTETLDPKNQKKGDFKEAFNIGEYKDGKPQQPLSGPLKAAEAQIGEFWEDCHTLCNRILNLLAIALKVPEDEGGAEWFAHRHDRNVGPSGSVLRLLHYPALPPSLQVKAGEDIRAGAHSDYGSITLLFRLPRQPGLEILTASGNWVAVPVDPTPGTTKSLPILVNIGDLLCHWTNGLLKSTVHRVIFPKAGEGPEGGEERLSMAFFCQPQDDAKLIPIPSRIVQERPPLADLTDGDNKVMTSRDHLNSRLAATYGIAKNASG